MKIAIITGPLGMGGAEYQSYLIAKYLSNYHDVHLISVVRGKQSISYENDSMQKIKIKFLKKMRFVRQILGKDFLFDYFRLKKILNEINPDIIYCKISNAYTGIVAKYSKMRKKKSILHISHDNDVLGWSDKVDHRFILNYFDKKLLEYGIRNVDYVIAQTRYQSNILEKNYGRQADLIFPNSHPAPKEKIEKKHPIRILWIANIKPIKCPEIFIELAKMFEKENNCKFIMIGRPTNTRYQKKIEGLMQCVSNLNYLSEKSNEEVNRLLAESHLLVNTSLKEGFPNTFIQAWMRKAPVVSLNVDPDEIIKSNHLGFHSKNFSQLITDISTLIANQQLLEEIGDNALRYAMENHLIDKNINILNSFLMAMK